MRLFIARLLNCREISIARIYANGYTSGASAPAPTPTPAKKSNEDLATEVIRGLWGNGQERKSRLEAAGYNYYAVRQIVNDRLALARRGVYVGARSFLLDACRGLTLESTHRSYTHNLVGFRALFSVFLRLSTTEKKSPRKTRKKLKVRLNTDTCEDPDAI